MRIAVAPLAMMIATAAIVLTWLGIEAEYICLARRYGAVKTALTLPALCYVEHESDAPHRRERHIGVVPEMAPQTMDEDVHASPRVGIVAFPDQTKRVVTAHEAYHRPFAGDAPQGG